jgi:hypothetical protein
MSRISATIRQIATVVSHAMRDSGTGPYSAAAPMTPASRPAPQALTPALALEYVRELSADVRAGVVLAPDGALLAGPDELAAPARALLAAAGDAAEVEAVGPAGVVCAVRSDAHAVVAVCGRFALPGVVRRDLRVALSELDGRPAPDPGGAQRDAAGGPDQAVQRAAETLLSALQRGSKA